MTNKKRLGLAVPMTLYEKIRNEAKYLGKTINAVCLDALWNHFEKEQREKDAG